MEKTPIIDSETALRRTKARRTALIVGLIALLVYGGFIASVMIGK
jgi:hypothetical protein